MKVSVKTFFIQLIAATFIFLFTYTALSKLMAYSSFEATLHQSPVFKNYSSVFAWLVPVTELLITLLLFFPKAKLKGFYASLVLMSCFTLYIGYMLLFTADLPCSCGGVLQKMTWTQHLSFNIFFTVLAGMAIRLHQQKQKIITADSAVFV